VLVLKSACQIAKYRYNGTDRQADRLLYHSSHVSQNNNINYG